MGLRGTVREESPGGQHSASEAGRPSSPLNAPVHRAFASSGAPAAIERREGGNPIQALNETSGQGNPANPIQPIPPPSFLDSDNSTYKPGVDCMCYFQRSRDTQEDPDADASKKSLCGSPLLLTHSGKSHGGDLIFWTDSRIRHLFPQHPRTIPRTIPYPVSASE